MKLIRFTIKEKVILIKNSFRKILKKLKINKKTIHSIVYRKTHNET